MVSTPGAAERARASATVLVVDDEEPVRRLFVRFLQRAGLDAVEAGCGREGLARIRADGIDVVVLDNRMPDVTGLEVLAELRRDPATTTLPVILVTGQGEVEDRVTGLDTGADDYLAKPVHPDELVARVRAQLRGRDAWVETAERSWEERAEVIDRLGNLEPGATLEESAGRICSALFTLRGVRSATVLGFAGEDIVVLGRRGVGFPERARVHRSTARELRRRAHEGPWTMVTDVPGQDVPAKLLLALAPLESRRHMLGLLALGFDRDGTDAYPTGSSLSTTIDLAQAAAAVLAPVYFDGVEQSARRAGIERVLTERAFFPVFQPVVDLTTGATIGYEALTRFADGTAPAVRFSEAASVGLGIALEEATLDAAVAAADGLPIGGWLSVNASPSLLLHGDALARARRRLPRTMVVELTERDPVDDYDEMRRALEALPDTPLAVDDAGAGYASLRHVLTLEPTYIKLDMTWVRELEADTGRQAIVAGLNHFARLTDCQLVAEGIETRQERSTLRRLGVQLGQGFLFGAPVRIGEIDRSPGA